MLAQPHTLWFISSAGRGIDVDVARDEPSHIHIARPSRGLRREVSGDGVDLSHAARDLTAADVTVPTA